MVDKKLVNFLDYSRIYRDLKLKPSFNTKVLILCPINLSRQDISERMDIDLIRDGIMKRSPVFVEKIPVDSDSNFELPIVLAVPNPRSAVGGEVLNMMAVADVITDLAENTAISASWIDNF